MRKTGWAAVAAAASAPVSALAKDEASDGAASSMSSAISAHHDTVTYSYHYVGSHVHQGFGLVAILIFLILAVIGLALYFLPAIIATRRHHPNTLAIWLVNFFFGGTFIGWIIALIWALN